MSTVASPLPAASANPERPKGSRFTLGNKGGPGNPFARQVAEIRKLLLNAVPGERLAKVVLAMLDKAEAGDVAAAKLVLQYTVGKPAQTVEPDRIEIDDHRLRLESMIPSDEWVPRFGELPVQSANWLWARAADALEEETLLPLAAGALETEAAPPERQAEVERKTNRRLIRCLNEGIPPSPNGSIGRRVKELRRKLHGTPKPSPKRSKPAQAG